MQVQINIKELDGTIFGIAADSNSTIKTLKEQIKDDTGLSIEQQQLFFNNAELEDNKLIKDYKFSNQDPIYLIPRLEGGGPSMLKGFPDVNEIQEKGFSSTAPAYRTVCDGANMNAYCDACKKTVLISLGYCRSENVYFDIQTLSQNLLCSNCKANIRPRNCDNIYFYKCAWKFVYMLENDDKTYTGSGFTEDDDKFKCLDDNGQSKDYSYLYLYVNPKNENTQFQCARSCTDARRSDRKLETRQNIYNSQNIYNNRNHYRRNIYKRPYNHF